MFFKRSEKITLGGRTVNVREITIAQWKELFDTIDILPQLILNVVTAPANERSSYFFVALSKSFDDLVNIASVLTGLDADFIRKSASLDEMFAFYLEVAKVNKFGAIIKNVSSFLNPSGLR